MSRAKVIANHLNIRTGPDTSWPVTGSLYNGQTVEVVDIEGWMPILFEDQVRWVAEQYLESYEPEIREPIEYDLSTKEGAKAAILVECNQQGLTLSEQKAYVMATADWETNHTFQPVREAYWFSEDWRRRNLRYYPYYGRGLVQITWKSNYQKYSEILGIDLVNDPDLALRSDIAIFILVHGLKHGVFTGKKLEDYIDKNKTDFCQARRCVNALDKSREIAALAEKYLKEIIV